MLWHKSWLETRWRFLIGFAVLLCSACGTVLVYPRVVALLPLVPPTNTSGEIGRQIRDAVELSRTYRGYVWSQAFRQNLPQMATFIAALLGTEGLLAQASGSTLLYTLSMPVSRRRLFAIRAATGMAELLVVTVAPPLVVPLLSPAVGTAYGIPPALIHGLCLFVACAVFFALALLLSTVFEDLWRPLLIACGTAVALAAIEFAAGPLARFGLFHLMTGESYFRTGSVPWLGLLATAAASFALMYAASVHVDRRDF
jgi:hypothetical protein